MCAKTALKSVLFGTLWLLLATAVQGQAPPHDWSQAFGASGDDQSLDCVVDHNGNYVVVGFFCDKVDFGGGPVLSLGDFDGFVAKFDPSGGYIWSHLIGGLQDQVATAVDVDPDGGIYVTGEFAGTVDFGDGPVTSAGDSDIFLLKLDKYGDHVWSKTFGDPELDEGRDLVVDGVSGHVYLAGSFEARIDLGGGNLISSGGVDFFIAKLSTGNGSHVWSRSFGSPVFDSCEAIALDDAANIFITGACEGPMDFGGGIVPGPGRLDLFVAKYDAAGGHLWSRVLGSSRDDCGLDIDVDGSGGIILAGYFSGAADFGGAILESHGSYDILLARYDADGGHAWSRGFGGSDMDRGVSVTLNDLDQILLTGSFQVDVDFGGGPLPSDGDSDIFLAKFKGNGDHMWSEGFGGDGPDQGNGLAVDGDSNVIMVGHLGDWTDLGGGTLYADFYSLDAFVASYDTGGLHRWSDHFGGRGADFPRDLAVDADKNVILTGVMHGTIDFGGGPLIGKGAEDIFIAKFDGGGSHLWSKNIGSINDEQAERIAVDASGNTYVCGRFTSDIDFGGGIVSSSGDEDVFLVKFGPTGTYQWVKTFGDGLEEYIGSVAVDGAGNVILCGGFQGTVDFGGGPLTSEGYLDVFLAKYDPSGAHIWSKRFGSWNVQYGQCVIADAAGNIVMGGHFTDSIDFGGGPIIVDDVAKFLVKFESDGAYLWSDVFDSYACSIRDVAIGPTGNITITGSFYDYIDLGGGVLMASGNQDAFIGHYKEDGNHIWSTVFGNTGVDGGSKVAPTETGGFLATGFFEGSVDFGGGALVSGGERAAYLAEFNANGTHIWSQSYGETERAFGLALGTDSGGNILLGGGFSKEINLGGPTLTASGMDIFLAKLGPVTDVDPQEPPATAVLLRTGFPNPFDGETTVTLDIPGATQTSLAIYGASGRWLRTLVDRELEAGRHVFVWDGLDRAGRLVPAGVYFARLTTPGRRASVKLVRIE